MTSHDASRDVPQVLLDVHHLALRIGEAEILRDVSLSLRRGEVLGLLGPNGAGKTTTIAAALGLLPRHAGTVRLLGRDPAGAGAAVRARVGVLPDPNGFHDGLTAEESLAFFAGLYGLAPGAAELGRRLAQVGLERVRAEPVSTFSRGMRQRLGLARAMVADPELLVLDEPTAGLDPGGRREMHDLLLALAADRSTGILLCTHQLDEVERLCGRVAVIVEGRTAAEGGLSELLAARASPHRYRLRLAGPPPDGAGSPRHVRVAGRVGDWTAVDVDPAVPPEAAWRELLFLGWPVVEIERGGGGLEELYLDLTAGGAP